MEHKELKLREKDFTLEERHEIEKYLKIGISTTSIAKLLGRSSSGVVRETRRLGDRENYSAEEAHKHALSLLGNRTGKVSFYKELNAVLLRVIELEKTTRKLDSQLEIMYEIIKGLQNEKTNN